MSFIRSIENNIKGFFKVCFFLWIMTYVYAIFQIVVLKQTPSAELRVWSDFGDQAFTTLFVNFIMPYYLIKALILVVKKYPKQAKLVFSAMLVAAAYKVIEKSKH